MTLECKKELTLSSGEVLKPGQRLDVDLNHARLLLQKHGSSLAPLVEDKRAKHAPSTDKFSRRTDAIQTKFYSK